MFRFADLQAGAARVDFSELALDICPATDDVRFRQTALSEFCREAGIPAALCQGIAPAHARGLIALWYDAHLKNGGQTSMAGEELLAKVSQEACAEAS